MASASETNFEKIYSEWTAAALADSTFEHTAFVQSRLPTSDRILAFMKWQVKKRDDKRKSAYINVPNADDIRNQIMRTDFNNTDMVAQLNELLNRGVYPHIGLGIHKGCGYRLVPQTRLLASTDEPDYNDRREILPPIFLGINKTVQPILSQERKRAARNERGSDESASSANSDQGNDETGFVFFQLGKFEYCPSELFSPEHPKPNSLPWYDTGYVVVIAITKSGVPGDVHILYNFRPQDEEGDRIRVDERVWGHLPGDAVRRGGSLIARKFSDLRPNYHLAIANPEDPNDKTVAHSLVKGDHELVAVVRDGYPQAFLVRQRRGE